MGRRRKRRLDRDVGDLGERGGRGFMRGKGDLLV